MITSRRRLLFGFGATILAAPAIVRVAANLMPVSTRGGMSELERHFEHIEKLMRPPMIADPFLLNEPASIIPGMITFVSADHYRAFRPVFEILPAGHA